VSSHPGKMIWSIVDTPSTANNIIASPSEVNVIVMGFDDRTFYAVDIPNGNVHKSIDGGVTWTVNLGGAGGSIAAAGANLPVWNLALAPDDMNFMVAVTDGGAADPGPRQVFISEDGGARWQNTNFTAPGEYISCVGISVAYGANNRDIAIGTRTGGGTGRVFIWKYTGIGGNWNPQDATGSPASVGWPGGDVVSLKFSPTYSADNTLVVVYSSVTGTFLNAGERDVDVNFTNWSVIYVIPIELTTAGPGSSPNNTQIITADLELPTDFSGTDSSLRRFYVCTDAVAGPQSGIYRVDRGGVNRIMPPPATVRFSSIAYWGTYSEGVLLAGEVTAAALAPTPASFGVYIWRTSNPNVTVGTPDWNSSDARRSPTGGFGSGFANAQVAWSQDGTRAYCGTSSANLSLGGTGWGVVGRWPYGYTTAGGGSAALDESAFSVSPYAPAYEQLLGYFASYGKSKDIKVGNVWNQLSLIDTQLSILCDVAVLQAPETGEEGGVFEDYDIAYLASVDTAGYDSIWRSTSDPLGRTWERVLCVNTTNDDIILRVKQTDYEEKDRSDVIVFADCGTDIVGYSEREGQEWNIRSFIAVTDLALAEEDVIYILNNTDVYRYREEGGGWIQTNKVNTQLGSGHTIAVPLKNPGEGGETPEDWVIVGEAGVLSGMGGVAWADFSQTPVRFKPPLERWIEVPVRGNVHVIADDQFERNKIIYAAVNNAAGNDGKIYRWTIDESTEWDELEPPNSAFYGLAQRNDVLYGAWGSPQVAAITSDTGVDRTIYPRAKVPPPTEWDYLTEGLPTGVIFTREPSSLKLSSNEDNSLWAIDNSAYDWTNGIGCLWAYADTVAKVGPWTIAPASGDFIPVDPVTGRAIEIDFKWRQLSYASAYELQLAKDSDFSIIVLRNENIVPVDQLAPECYFPAGGLVPAPASDIVGFGNLEAGHTYYWRVRARVHVVGEAVRSPWSATMYFTVWAGLPVVAEYPTIALFAPAYGARGIPRSPVFSWSPMFKTAKYEFVLARDAALQEVIVKTNVSQTSYMYDGELDFNTNYYWQVRVVEPVVSDPSPIGTFTVVAEEKPAEPATEEPTPIPVWVWGVIAICTALVAVMIAFALVKPGYVRSRAAPVSKLKLSDDKPRSPIAMTTEGRQKVAPADKLELPGDKPQSTIAGIQNVMTRGVKRSAAPVDKLELAGEKRPNPIARIWNAIKTGLRRSRYLGKRRGGGLDDL
jgi:hypothetical protein